MSSGEGKTSSKRGLLYAICLIFVFLEAGLYAARQQTSKRSERSKDGVQQTLFPSSNKDLTQFSHPIPKLMADAEDKFRGLLDRQSKTFEEAVNEYQRRYGRNPPKGFDDWYLFAKTRNVKIIDDYDAINEDLSPFWTFTGTELRRRVDLVSVSATQHCFRQGF